MHEIIIENITKIHQDTSIKMGCVFVFGSVESSAVVTDISYQLKIKGQNPGEQTRGSIFWRLLLHMQNLLKNSGCATAGQEWRIAPALSRS